MCKGFIFKSDTDSEVIVNLIDYYYNLPEIDIDEAIKMATDRLEGTYGLVIQCIDNPLSVYIIRNGSPILVGENERIFSNIFQEFLEHFEKNLEFPRKFLRRRSLA